MSNHPPLFRFPVYPAAAFQALSGANEGDPIGLDDAAVPGDIYRLTRRADLRKLAISDTGDGGPCVADGSEVARPGEALSIEACHLFMGPSSEMVEVLILSLDRGPAMDLLLLPLAPIQQNAEYELVESEVAAAPERFADIASVSFLAGTHLTMADGRQVAVEELAVGDRVLTRDHGPQPIRWIGHHTRRATGSAAPIRITEGTLNVARDLRLSPQHRLFIWQRVDELGAGRAEVMVKADLLVNGNTVLREEGGHFDSYLLVFDGHEIVFAEGVAVESLLVTGQTRALLPEDLGLDVSTVDQRDAAEIEVDETSLRGDDAAERLTRASRGED